MFYDKLFSSLDFTLPRAATGRRGFPKEAMVCAFIVMKCEGFSQITDLVDYLDNNRLIARYCGFNIMEPLPSYWTYDRFLRQLDNGALKAVMTGLVRQLYELGIVDASFIGLDSTPVMANTKQNNPKSFAKSKFSKENHPKSDPDCALGVHSASNQHNERRYEFYWGYKSHVLVDCTSGLPLYELTTPGNIADSSVAAEILASADRTISLKECAFLADKGYDAKSIYNTVKTVYDGEAFIPLNPRGTKDSKALSAGNPVCEAGLAMHKDGKTTDNGRTRQKYCCPFRQSKTGACPCSHKNWNNGKKTGAARNTRPFPMTTGFPLTTAVSISSGLTPCGRSVSVTIPASNPQVRNGCGGATAQARRTSTHWLISLLWRLRWPPFCPALTPTAHPNHSGEVLKTPPHTAFFARFSSGPGFYALFLLVG